jgi:DNA-binding CsgD family transcriptional regulator
MRGAKTDEPEANARGADNLDPLARARACFARDQWEDAYQAFCQADGAVALEAVDLERFVASAILAGWHDGLTALQERLFHARLSAGQQEAAARVAGLLASRLLARGELGHAGGWLARAQRLIEKDGDCVAQGYLLLPIGQRHLSARELQAAHDAAARAATIGERAGEADLVAFARNLLGRVLLAREQLEDGLRLLDEVMVTVRSGGLSPLVTGLLYCSTIASCQRVYALDRAREWTTALASWCEAHPQLAMFSGECHVHRSEVLQICGSWPEAIEEARLAGNRGGRIVYPDATGRALYQQAEIHRLRGEFAAAEADYRAASQAGVEPQPGLALLRLAQGDREAAATAIRRVVGALGDPLQRARYLPAHLEIMLASGDLQEATAACAELQEAAARWKTDVLAAIAAHARAALALAQGNPRAAIDPAREAFRVWQQTGAPYLAARLRVLLAHACLALGDAEGAGLELAGAREVFSRLGAAPDVEAVDALAAPPSEAGPRAVHRGLTARELEVLRLVASGKTNKAIAAALGLSEKTVDRHVSNIFNKIDVSSRAAATAYAYEHRLV